MFGPPARTLPIWTVCALLAAADTGRAALPNHPFLTEVFTDPPGDNDGPVGRPPSNPHQEFIEIYLPPADGLSAGLNKDALRLAFYEVEGDSSSSGTGLVNTRIDLPTFDLDPTNGLTPGATARPASGVLVLGWVDYIGDPPVALAGTTSTRVGLVNGGLTSAPNYTFVAINGAQFGGTTNFPVPAAVSQISLPNDARNGLIQNGSAVFLLVNRDDPGYVQLYDDGSIPPGGSADPALAAGAVLRVSCLQDAFAGNDDSSFDVLRQPYVTPTGLDLDLETVLPAGGAFSMLAAQTPEDGSNGYARVYLDDSKTTEDGVPGNENPAADAVNAYRTILNAGPFYPTPGRAHRSSDAPELSVASASRQMFDVLAGTTGRPGVVCANVGGRFGITVSAAAGASSNPSAATFGPADAAVAETGPMLVYPSIAATAPMGAVDGASATTNVALNATGVDGAPPVVNAAQNVVATVRVLNPTRGQTAQGQPFQATVFAAIHGLPRQPGVSNEFLATSLAAFVDLNPGGVVDDGLGRKDLLLDPQLDLSDSDVVDSLERDMPDDPALFINAASPAGRESLVATVLSSAEVQAGNSTYTDSFDAARTAIRAIAVDLVETATRGGSFVPTERMHFVDAVGQPGEPPSGLSDANTTRGFELALLDTNVQSSGELETGATDDFGLIVQAGRVRAGSPVVSGEFIFLSFTGGLEGADIDSLDVPPHQIQTVIIYVDLDLLDVVLGCETITRLIVIDGSGSGTANVIEAFSLNAVAPQPCSCRGDVNLDQRINGQDVGPFVARVVAGENPAGSLQACAADLNSDGRLDSADVALMPQAALRGACP